MLSSFVFRIPFHLTRSCRLFDNPVLLAQRLNFAQSIHTSHRMSVVHKDKSLSMHYDPANEHLQKALDLAKETGASEKVILAIQESLKLCQQRDDYVDDLTMKQSETCAKIIHETTTHDWQKAHDEKKTAWKLHPAMMSGHLEGQFLKSFLSAQKAKRVLDIGMFTGYSAVSIAEALPADGKVLTMEKEQYLKGIVEALIKDSPHKDKIEIMMGPALETMTMLKEKSDAFDAIFMDAAKSEYKDYLKLCIEDGLLAPGGTLLVDNAFMHGSAYTKPDSPTAKFGELIKSNPDLHVVLVPIRDGIYLIRRRIDVDGGVA